jgi:coenzyme F420-dependent glucose-6-phosphate dehydrogenase
MVKLGYALSSEEHDPQRLVDLAKLAEDTGFSFAFISDHFHPWIEQQGHSPFVWGVLGAISQATSRIEIATGVTCPIIRIHPAIIAQAAATAQLLLKGRFKLGLGTGEHLNEHITGEGWPQIDIRQEMLKEAVDIIRFLWEGRTQTYYGTFYTVEDAKIYSLPEKLPEILIAASGEKSALIAGEIGDGFISTSAEKNLVEQFDSKATTDRPKYGQFAVCYNENKMVAVDTALKWWPTAAMPGQLHQELRLPAYFDMTAKLVRPDDIEKVIICGGDKDQYIQKIKEFADAGFTHVYIHNVGPEQESFMEFMKNEILPEYQ